MSEAVTLLNYMSLQGNFGDHLVSLQRLDALRLALFSRPGKMKINTNESEIVTYLSILD